MNEVLQGLNGAEMAVSDTGVPFLYFRRLAAQKGVRHGCSTRAGGVSSGCFSSMNLGFGRGDSEENVLENYRRICGAIGIRVESVVLPDQVHELTVRRASKADCGKGLFLPRDYTSVDAQITNEPEVALAVFGADCVPVFFYDPETRAIGTAHAGWRGTIGRIAGRTVTAMQREFGCRPETMQAYIGISVCGNCYTVGGETAQRFQEEFPAAIRRDVEADDTWKLDLWKVNRMILEESGLKKEHIITGGVCTMCHPDILFSHRVAGDARGNMAGFLMLTEEE